MAESTPQATEHSPLLPHPQHAQEPRDRRLSHLANQDEEASSIVKSHISVSEQAMATSTVGERLAYNAYTTTDWLHDLVKDSYRHRTLHARKGIRARFLAALDSSAGWIAAALIGTLTACVAFAVDVAEATVSDWKLGYCARNPVLSREACCEGKTPLFGALKDAPPEYSARCDEFVLWSTRYGPAFAIYVAFALAFGIVSASVTMLTKRALPSASVATADKGLDASGESSQPVSETKSLYMAAGSGIPEIKTILSGFVIPNFLDLKVLVVKAVGAVFAVATGMCLGKSTLR